MMKVSKEVEERIVSAVPKFQNDNKGTGLKCLGNDAYMKWRVPNELQKGRNPVSAETFARLKSFKVPSTGEADVADVLRPHFDRVVEWCFGEKEKCVQAKNQKYSQRGQNMKKTDMLSAVVVAGLVLVMPGVAQAEYASEIWVDAVNGSDSNKGTNETTAVKTLRKAETLSTNGGVVRVKPGVYSTNWYAFNTDWGPAVLSFVNKTLHVVSTDGPEVTIIQGTPCTVTDNGDGTMTTNYVRCVQNYNSADPVVEGFTLTGGDTGLHDNRNHNAEGSVVCAENQRTFLLNCIVTGNQGRRELCISTTLINCVVTNNHLTSTYSSPTLAQGCNLFNCYVGDNNCLTNGSIVTYASGKSGISTVYFGKAVNSTFVNNGFYSAVGTSCSAYNNVLDSSGVFAASVSIGNVVNSADFPLIDPLSGDIRVRKGSSAETAGDAQYRGAEIVEFDTHGWIEASWRNTDIKKNSVATNGTIMAGCLQESAGYGVYISTTNGLSGATAGMHLLTGEETITVSAGNWNRPVIGVMLNGVTNLFQNAANNVITFDAAASAAGTTLDSVLYSNDWYVDAENGNDGAYGYYPACAKKTLAAAITNANLKSGDRVIALPGTYDEGTMYQPTALLIPARAVVPNGVTLKSRDGAKTTFIKGKASDITDVPTVPKPFDFTGCGSNAVRCVYLNGANAEVDGFTLTNGFTRACKDDGTYDHGGDDYVGAGAKGSGLVKNCIITGCKSYRGAGAYTVKALNCIFDGNSACYGGGATSDAYNYNCLSRNNVCVTAGWAGFFHWPAAENCTALDGMGDGAFPRYVMRNCLVLGPTSSSGGAYFKTNFVNCAFADDKGGSAPTMGWKTNILGGVGNILTNSSCLAVDAEGRPTIGANVAIDKGDSSINSGYIGASDLSGGQRVYNGAMDIGALEADWRTHYAQSLGGRLFTVTAAPGTAKEQTNGQVRLIGGELTATWAPIDGTSSSRELNYSVPGNGTLTVTVDGKVVDTVTAGNSGSYRFSSGTVTNSLAFSYTAGENDTLGALLGMFKDNRGLVLLLK